MQNLIEQFKDRPLLITCSAWFCAPDGKQYLAAWGRVRVYSDADTLGVKTNNQSTNWYVTVGEGNGAVVIAGCQIKYAVVCENTPNTERQTETRVSETQAKGYEIERQNVIYLTPTP